MDETQIAELVKLIENSKMPQWWTEYAAQLAYNLQVHTKGLMFDKITGLYPNEHPESQKHCINSFEAITKGSIWKAINNIIRVFNNSSYNIQISDKTKALIDEYQNSEGSLFSQFLEDWIRYAVAEDPNGICVIYPPEYTDDLYRYVCFKDIVLVKDDLLIFKSYVESEKKQDFKDEQYQKEIFYDYEYLNGAPNVRHTTVRTFNRRLETTYVNTVYHVFTLTHFIRFYKDSPGDREYKFEFIAHPRPLDTLPYFENGGVEVEAGLYESFVQPFVPFGNLALMAHRNQRAVDLMFSYPRMSEVQQECDVCQGTGEVACIATSAHPSGRDTCKTCRGSKYVTIQSPYKVYRKTPNSFDVDNRVLSTPSVEFYTPDVGIIEYNSKQVDKLIEQAEEAVFVQQRQDTGAVQAAKSKQLDQEGLFAWLSNISKVLYNNLEMFLQALENYVNASPIKVSVERPYSFAILSESEALEAMTTMLLSGAPVLLKAPEIDNFVNKFVSESSPVKRALQILKQYDTLLYYSDDTLASYRGLGSVSNKDLIRHIYAYPVLIQMYSMNPTLFELTDEQIISKLTVEVDKYDLTKDIRTNLLTAIPPAASA